MTCPLTHGILRLEFEYEKQRRIQSERSGGGLLVSARYGTADGAGSSYMILKKGFSLCFMAHNKDRAAL